VENDSLAAVRAPGSELQLPDEIELLLFGDPPASSADDVRRARSHAQALAATLGNPREAAALAAVTFVAETLAASWLDRQWDAAEIDRLVDGVATALAIDRTTVRTSIFCRAILDRHVLDLPPQLGAEIVLKMLCTFAPAQAASLWTASPNGRLAQMVQAGDEDSSRRGRSAAREAIAEGRSVTSARSQHHSVPVERWGQPSAALVLRCRPDDRARALAYAAEAAVTLAPVIEFDALLQRNASRERSLTGASERRLTRLGFDLHDGPMQDIAALATDLRLFRRQLGPLLAHGKDAVIALGRIDDLEARLVSVDQELRELARSLQSPAGLRVPLEDAIQHEIATFRAKSGMEVELSMTGSFDALTASQKIALVRLVQEALSNIRDHSEARSVQVRIGATRTRLMLDVADDGRGFDVEERLLQAARAGRLGIVGMGERIRLLGGRFEIESKPGGPTRVRASMPRWRPLAQEASSEV
jgi:signal transduction histidine kinase